MQESQNYIQTINNWINSNTTFLNSVPPEILNQLKFLVSSEIKQAEERVVLDLLYKTGLHKYDGKEPYLTFSQIQDYAKEHSIELK